MELKIEQIGEELDAWEKGWEGGLPQLLWRQILLLIQEREREKERE